MRRAMRKVFQAANLFDAQIVLDRLRAGRIEARIFNANAAAIAGLIPVTETWPEVWILDERDFALAKRVVESFEAERQGYPSLDLHCPHCGERVPGNFSHCWSCQRELSSCPVD